MFKGIMRLHALLFAALLAVVPATLAQGPNITFISGLVQTLQSRNLTSFASIVQSINGSGVGQFLLANISNGEPHLLFIPNNGALANAPSNVTSNPNLLTDVVGYHIVPGNFSGTIPTFPNDTVGRTLLTDPNFVQLEGNKAQVVAWALRADGKTHVLNQRNDTTVVDFTSFQNLTLFFTDEVLTFPESLNLTIPTLNNSLSSFETIANQVQVPFFNASSNSTTNITLFNALNSELRGFTLFAPDNSAIANASSTLQGLSSNTSALQAVLQNHLINGTTYYSPQLVNTNFTSASGEPLSFTVNSTGRFVTSGNTTALILQPDVLLSNGVVHIIDTFLINNESNSSAAASAEASASSAALVSTTETGPIVAPTSSSTPSPVSSAPVSTTSAL